MCWSGEASGVLAAIGIGTALYSAKKKMHPILWVTLGYFSLMELLQAFTYGVIDRCELPSNQIMTLLGYFLSTRFLSISCPIKNCRRKSHFPLIAYAPSAWW